MDVEIFTTSSDIVRSIVRVWMANAVRTDAFHDALITTPVQRPRSHVMVRRLVNATVFPFAFRLVVSFEKYHSHNASHLNHFELHVNYYLTR